jgi:hypothetical protein
MSRLIAWVLPAMLVLGLAFSSNGAENKYVGDPEKNCKLCHKDQVTAWAKWPMAKAWDRLDDKQKKDEKCFTCHVTGYKKPGGFVSYDKTPKLVGIQCEACHGPAGDHMKVPLNDKAKKKSTMTVPSEASCKVCHAKAGNPNFKEFKYSDAVKKLADHKPKK